MKDLFIFLFCVVVIIASVILAVKMLTSHHPKKHELSTTINVVDYLKKEKDIIEEQIKKNKRRLKRISFDRDVVRLKKVIASLQRHLDSLPEHAVETKAYILDKIKDNERRIRGLRNFKDADHYIFRIGHEEKRLKEINKLLSEHEEAVKKEDKASEEKN